MTAMELLRGLKDGALLQRDGNGLCRCVFTARADGALKTTLGILRDNGNGEYVLTGIPAGGPYDLELSDSSDRKKLTVWVGDLWILAGLLPFERRSSLRTPLLPRRSPPRRLR